MFNIFEDMTDEIENFDWFRNYTNKLEIWELKSVITEIKNSFNGLSNRLDTVEERITKIKYWSKENVQKEERQDQR